MLLAALPNCIAYVLAKNEAPNIGRTVSSLVACGLPVVVLDSGSTDRTAEIASSLGAHVEPYAYSTHADAYRYLCVDRADGADCVLVLDADMVVSEALVGDVFRLFGAGARVVSARIRMCWAGVPLRFASLCPPKAILFAKGEHYFEAVGHGERLRPGVASALSRLELLHDDRKTLAAYLSTQERYANALLSRAQDEHVSLSDRVRLRSPLMVVVTPLVSYVLRRGALDGWAGLGYALDRVIAEAIMTREAVNRRVRRASDVRASDVASARVSSDNQQRRCPKP